MWHIWLEFYGACFVAQLAGTGRDWVPLCLRSWPGGTIYYFVVWLGLAPFDSGWHLGLSLLGSVPDAFAVFFVYVPAVDVFLFTYLHVPLFL